MSCRDEIVRLDLPETRVGCTWAGLSWKVIDAGESTEYQSTLALAEFIAKDWKGNAVVTLTSATAGQVTITTATANAWDVTVEPRILPLSAGYYSFTLYTTDSQGVRSNRWEGTFKLED